jgi:hypothetical protein
MSARRGLITLACLLGLITPTLWFGSLVTPGEEAVRIRNGLAAEVGEAGEFEWTPAQVPKSFKLNQAEPTTRYRSVAATIRAENPGGTGSGLDAALAISRHLMQSPVRSGGAIQRGLDETYQGIAARGRGYCADFTRVFSGLAIAMGLPVRTWSISFEGFGAGHSVNEIYDTALSKWVLVDSFHSLYFVDPTTREPLSVLELHDRLLFPDGEAAHVAIQPIIPARVPFKSDALALDYYRRGFSELALVWGNNVFDYDESSAIRAAAHASRHVERAVAIGLDVYPDLKIYPRGRSQRDVDALFRTRDRFIAASSLLVLSLAVFGYLLVQAWKTPLTSLLRRRTREAGWRR